MRQFGNGVKKTIAGSTGSARRAAFGEGVPAKRIAMLFLCFLPMTGYAGDQSGPVVEVRVASATLNGNPTHFKLDGGWTNKPACAATGYWAINTDTAAGKSLLAALLFAQATGKAVTVWGSGQCTLRSDMENANQVETK